MLGDARGQLAGELAEIDAAGLYKSERLIASPQRGEIAVAGEEVINLCANNYLGLADHPEVIAAAHEALDRWGYGMASVRFICGTQEIHVELERRLSEFLGTEKTILYSSCFDANGGVFETLLGGEDAVISDALNHASIIDGIRLSKARRLRYANGDMEELEARLVEAGDARRRLVVTDGVFSMDGYLARLDRICDLAESYDAMVMVDDSHAVGFVGPTGRGTPELFGVVDRVDIVTGTLGKALGGASGGYVSGRGEIVDLLRRRSRPYLFSNALAPPIVAASLRVLDLLERGEAPLDRLRANTALFRREIAALGYEVLPGDHPIAPVMFGDVNRASEVADRLLGEGVYVIAFSYPVVPMGAARIRTQMSAAHDEGELRRAIEAFARVR
ncbi:MAG TPA: glycine C-acetyltransferase [Solirubrobacterales bacterium]|nr:glycine C-acetyltransferase [Solirubrobacterales bacterium]